MMSERDVEREFREIVESEEVFHERLTAAAYDERTLQVARYLIWGAPEIPRQLGYEDLEHICIDYDLPKEDRDLLLERSEEIALALGAEGG
jgi:hypothetical protein